MSREPSFLACFACRTKKPCKLKNITKFKQNGTHYTESLVNFPSDTDVSHIQAVGPRPTDGSNKETVSLSTTSHTPGLGDAASASLGGWSVTQPVDGFDVSKVNLVPSEDSASVIRTFLGTVSSRSMDLGDECFERFESLVSRLERLAGIPSNHYFNDTGLKAFQNLIDKLLPIYCDLSRDLDQPINLQSNRVLEAFLLIRDLINAALEFSKPDAQYLDDYYKPLSYKLMEIGDFDRSHVDPLTRHCLVLVADSSMALAWCSSQTASGFVKEVCEAANAFANKTFQYCSSNQTEYADWIRAWMACLRGLQEIVDEHFPHGLVWNPRGLKPQAARRLPSPHLLYRNRTCDSSHASESTIKRRPNSNSLFTGRAATRQYSSQSELIMDLSKTRQSLRHVRDPENLWQ